MGIFHQSAHQFALSDPDQGHGYLPLKVFSVGYSVIGFRSING